MTEQTTKHLSELARANSRVAEQIDEQTRRVWFWRIIAGLALFMAILVAIVAYNSKPKPSLFGDTTIMGPFKVGYSDHGPPFSASGGWDYCQGVDLITGPTVCISGPPPLLLDNSSGPKVTPTPASYGQTPTATAVRSIIAPTERRVVPQPTINVPHHSGAPVNPGTVSVEDILAAGGLCGVPGSVAVRIAARESGMRQFDKRGRLLRSKSGAVGVLQVKPIAAREVSKTLHIERTWDNLIAGFCYLSSRKGDWPQKIRSYRAGSRGKATPEVEAYVATIMEGFEQ